MAQPELPSEFDVIVIGTGLEESIIAASSARNGHSVLHIDTNDFYGDSWAAFNFRGIQEWIQSCSKAEKKPPNETALQDLLREGEKAHLLNDAHSVTDINEQWFVAEDDTEESFCETEEADNEEKVCEVQQTIAKKPAWTRAKITQERMFNLDLTPRLLYSRGSMVDLLIQSNISRYTEFKAVSRILTVLNGNLEHVPSSRADVFSTKHVSVIEKRILMKYLTFCLDFQEHPEVYEEFAQGVYIDFLKHQKLTDNLVHFVMHSIAMVDKSVSTLDGLKATQKFLSSLGRFGNTPFLYSSFGSGELPQAFCRLCAVFGGTYYLGKSIDAIITNSNDSNCIGIISDGKRINCQKLVMPGLKCPDLLRIEPHGQPEVIQRKICLSSESILPSENEQLTFLSIHHSKSGSFTYVIEAGNAAAVCPRGISSLQMTKSAHEEESLDEDLKTVMPNQQNLLWSLDFNITTQQFESNTESVFLTSGPHFELDYDRTIAAAQELYVRMFPEDPFLPRAPDPEEIILGEPDDNEVPESGVNE